MSKLLKSSTDISKAPSSVLQKMDAQGAEFVTFVNSFAAKRFIATRSYVAALAHNKTNLQQVEVNPTDCIEVGSSMSDDELLYEMSAKNVSSVEIVEGLGQKTSISLEGVTAKQTYLANPETVFN